MHARRVAHSSLWPSPSPVHWQLQHRNIRNKRNENRRRCDAMRLQWTSCLCLCCQATTTNTWFRCLASAKHFLAIKSLKRPSLTYSNNMYFVHTISWNETNSAMHLADAKQYTAKTNWFRIRTTSCLSRRKTCFYFVCCCERHRFFMQ